MEDPVCDFWVIRGSKADEKASSVLGQEVTLTLSGPRPGRAIGVMKAGLIDITDGVVKNQYLLFGRIIG